MVDMLAKFIKISSNILEFRRILCYNGDGVTTMSRVDKHNYYLDIAQAACARSTCLRRKFGAIIVTNDEIISSGYNGAPRGRKNCIDLGTCVREKLNIPRGTRYEICRSVHAEANCIISAKRGDMLGGTMYLAGVNAQNGEIVNDANSCAMCKRLLINAGLNRIIVRTSPDKYSIYTIEDFIQNEEMLSLEGY